jgi:hypothetical protein
MDSDDIDDATRTSDKALLKTECENLLSEIHRLELSRKTQDDRVQNVQNLVSAFSKCLYSYIVIAMPQVYTSVDIEDSKAMKRLSYITMIFLPASFVAVSQFWDDEGRVLTAVLYSQNAFGMNVVELNPGGHIPLARFFEAMFPLTMITVWVIVAFQSRFVLRDDGGGAWKKLLWPILFANSLIPRRIKEDDSAYELPFQRR